MKSMRHLVPAIAGALLIATIPLATAQDTVVYKGSPAGSEMRIDGKATGKSWDCVGKIIAGDFKAESAWQTDLSLKSVTSIGPGKTAPECTVRIPVRSLKSSGGRIMDNRMLSDMNAEKYPNIEFKLTELVINGEVPESGSPVKFDATGDLAISGVTNKVSFPITMERVGNDKLKFAGSYNTKMSDFGIKPPEFTVLGIGLRTADEVSLSWNWMTTLAQ
jgi:polyisoprenoid-binding protein YceI